MEHHVDPDASAPRQRDQRLRDRLQPLAPAFAPMAGDQQATAGSAVAQRRWRQPRLGAEQGIDPGVAGHMHLAADSFALKIGRGLLGRSEQQLGAGVDGSAIFLLGPGQTVIVSASPASTWATGMPAANAPNAAPSALDVSPWTTSRSGPRPSVGWIEASTLRTCAWDPPHQGNRAGQPKSRRARTRAGRVTDAGRSAPGAAHGLARPVPERRVTV